MAIEAVVFDLGGVFFPWSSPDFFTRWAERLGCDPAALHANLCSSVRLIQLRSRRKRRAFVALTDCAIAAGTWRYTPANQDLELL
jgi:hypothetical protein